LISRQFLFGAAMGAIDVGEPMINAPLVYLFRASIPNSAAIAVPKQ
jgi:hypothetical protein